uniref:Pentatricopeptide repeat-containing protein n=1 Tax=Kalanchoe fedtschenkoi TaxID=63787 RepID=A0A7N0TPC0_KALFE
MAILPIRQLLGLRSASIPYSTSTAPNPCATLLHKCLNSSHLFQIHAQLIVSGRFRTPFVVSKLLKQALDFGFSDYTLLIFHHIHFPAFPDTVCVNTAIKACSTPHRALLLYFRMLGRGFRPNSYTFPPLISSCSKAESFHLGALCHGQSIKNGVDSVVPVANSLIHMYGCFGLVEVARHLFDEMCHTDVVSWNSMVDGYVGSGDMDAARKSFDEMPIRNEVSWNIMIGGYLKSGNPGNCLKLFREMMGRGMRYSYTTMVLVITACARSARLKEGRSIHLRSIKNSSNWSLLVDTSLIDMYSKCRRVDTACRVFDRMVEKNLISWNAMIVGHCIHGNPEEGFCLFNRMINSIASDVDENNTIAKQEQVVCPDETTYIALLCACVRAGLLEEGRRHFTHMVDVWNIKPNFAHYWCMSNILANAGLIEEAEDALRNMPAIYEDLPPQSLVWASLLTSCRFIGDISKAEGVGYSLIDSEPENSLCYALLSNIYAVAGRWDDVARIRDLMKQRRIGILRGCSLYDLKTVVHDLKVENDFFSRMELTNIISEQAEC